MTRALTNTERGLGAQVVKADANAIHAIAVYANGDARSALNLLELSVGAAPVVNNERQLSTPLVQQAIQRRMLLYDKSGE